MNRNVVLLVIYLITFACTDNEIQNPTICSVENPIENLTWLNAIVTDTMNQQLSTNYKIYQVEKDNQIFIIPYYCCIACNYVITIYDCNGKEVGFLGELLSFDESISNENLIWEPAQFTCIDE